MKRALLIPLVVILLISSLWSQQKQHKIVIKQEIAAEDSSKHMVFFDHHADINIEMLDSSGSNVFVYKKPVIEEQVARIVIKKTGFFRKNKIIIDFDPRSKTILKVVDNDKDVDENKFHKYQEYLEEATELSDLEALHPKMEELEYKLQMMEMPDTGMMADLQELIIELDGLESEHALLKKKHYASIVHVIELEKLADVIQDIFVDAGKTPPQKIKKMRINGEKFFLNDEEIKGELGKKCIEAYFEHSQIELDEKGPSRWFESADTEVDIQIIFD